MIDNEEVGLEAAILERKRNSSLIERFCAKDNRGSNMIPKLRACVFHRGKMFEICLVNPGSSAR